jgi:DNA polymerase-3 subunit epsilon
MDLFEAERAIEAHPDYRLLRRVPPVSSWRLRASSDNLRRAVFVDTETTGLDLDRDEVIELALLPFDYDRDSGEIVRVDEAAAFNALRQPSFPIPEESTRVHGITNADVAGRSIADADVQRALEGAHIVIAHNAAFDRPMVEKHWPLFAEKHWACSLAEIAWKEEGLTTGKLDYLLLRQGWFYEAHRALGDALAGAFLLSLQLPLSKTRALHALLECARRPLWAVRAEETAFEQRAALKQRGYRWDAGSANRPKAWWILTDDPDAERDWLNTEIYAPPRVIPAHKMDARKRYSGRIWDQSDPSQTRLL